jgi:hypothetical protein
MPYAIRIENAPSPDVNFFQCDSDACRRITVPTIMSTRMRAALSILSRCDTSGCYESGVWNATKCSSIGTFVGAEYSRLIAAMGFYPIVDVNPLLM